MNLIIKKSTSLLLALAITLTTLVFSSSLVSSAAEQKTAIGLAEFGLKAYRDNWQYNYGSYGEMGSNGLNRSDCSGLIYAYLCWQNGSVKHDYSMPRTVTAQANRSVASGPISTLPRTHGLLLTIYDYNHVGIYLGNNRSVDNSDYGTNMVLRTVSNYPSWIKWHKLDCVQYPTTGWYTFDGQAFYYENGEYVINTSRTLDGVTYSFDSTGKPSATPPGYPEDGGGTDGGVQNPDNVSLAGKTTADVNLRTGPGLSYNVDRVVGTDTSLTVTNKDTAGWYKVTLSNGSVGYISADYVSLSGGDTPGLAIAAVTTVDVNLRQQPSTSSAVQAVLGQGTSLTIIEKTNASWYKVKLPDGSTGYIYASYLKETNAATPTPTATPTPAPPAVEIAGQTTVDLNLRSGAGTSYSVLRVVGSGTAVTITDKSTSGWYKVKLADGTVGYMSSDYVREGSAATPVPPTPSVSIAAKTTADVNLRSGAGTNYSVIRVVANGTAVIITDNTTAGWYKVKLASGSEGYMSSDYVRADSNAETPNPVPPTETTSAATTVDVNLRTGPGTSYSVIDVIGQGTALTITDTSNAQWYKVTLSNGTIGYISAQYIALGSTGGGSSQASTRTTTADLNLRSGASTSSAVLTIAAQGTTVTVLDTSNSGWYKVRLPSGQEGYMSTDYLA